MQVGQHLVAAVGAPVGGLRGYEGTVHQLLSLTVAALAQQPLNLRQTVRRLRVVVVGAGATPHTYLVEHHMLVQRIAVGRHAHAPVAHWQSLLPLPGRRRVPECSLRRCPRGHCLYASPAASRQQGKE